MSLAEIKQAQSLLPYFTHCSDQPRQNSIRRDLAGMRMQRVLEGAVPCKGKFGINSETLSVCL